MTDDSFLLYNSEAFGARSEVSSELVHSPSIASSTSGDASLVRTLRAQYTRAIIPVYPRLSPHYSRMPKYAKYSKIIPGIISAGLLPGFDCVEAAQM